MCIRDSSLNDSQVRPSFLPQINKTEMRFCGPPVLSLFESLQNLVHIADLRLSIWVYTESEKTRPKLYTCWAVGTSTDPYMCTGHVLVHQTKGHRNAFTAVSMTFVCQSHAMRNPTPVSGTLQVTFRPCQSTVKPTRSLAIAKRPCDCCIILKSESYTKAI